MTANTNYLHARLWTLHAFNPGQNVPCENNPQLFEAHPDDQRTNQAKAICYSCPVLDECRMWALQHELGNEMIMGGLTQRERIRLVYGHRRQQRPPNVPNVPREPRPPREPNMPWRCPKNHSPANYYPRNDNGGMRCRTCKRAADRDRKRRTKPPQPPKPAGPYICQRNHTPDRYRNRKDGRQYCLECQQISARQRRQQQQLQRHVEKISDQQVGLREHVDGCQHGHPATRRYRQPSGLLRCADCMAEYNQRRRGRKKVA